MSYKRAVPKTTDHLREMSKILAQHSGDLEAIAMAMEANGFAELGVPNDDQRRRSLEYMEKWMHAARLAILGAKEDRRDFGPHKPNGRKRPKRKSLKVVSDSA